MWKQPIPTANYQCLHSNWVLGLGIGNTSTLATFLSLLRRGSGMREWGTGLGARGEENVKMWKQPIPMLPIINVSTRIGCWVLALATLPHWQHFFPESRPQRLTQVASRHARVTLASMWLRRAMPYATIDARVEVDGTCGKSDCGVAATGGVVATSVLTRLLRPAIGRLR